MNVIAENIYVEELTKYFKRSELQLNSIHQSDAEIIKPFKNFNSKLAITTDSIVEEIAVGLYDDPYLIGWMVVMVNLSDLAAVGAEPLGILISEIIPKNISHSFIMEMQRGINDACKECDTFVLGGDTNKGANLILTGCALGKFNSYAPNYRTGCNVGDLLYASNYLGGGNAFAITKLLDPQEDSYKYFPVARIKEGQALRGFATACMDTSDGVISTLDQLMRLNDVGFEMNSKWENSLESEAKQIAENIDMPYWLLLAGQHGEFELLFTIKESYENHFNFLNAQMNWNPIKLGKVTEKKELTTPLYGQLNTIDSARIRNLSNIANNDVSEYLNALLSLDREMKKSL
ncbi:MAG: thiamine-monophosphate kinase [Bacteroidetes bacterium]|nr:thiamine-monophosphate kinase [Bacteroidota bacterium]